MKIGFLTPEFPSQKTGNSGGIGTSIRNLSAGLLALGHEVSILIYNQNSDEVYNENGLEIYRIKNIKIKGLSHVLTQYKITKFVNNLYQNKKLDILEIPDWTGFMAFFKPKCPMIVKLHGSDTYFCYLENRKVKPKNKWLEKQNLKNVDGVIAVSDFVAQISQKIFDYNFDYTVIPNGIALPTQVQIQEPKAKTILYFGTLIRKKGALEIPHIFNKVFANDSAVQLVLIGKDAPDITTNSVSTWQLMQPLFSKKALQNVSYLGAISYSEIFTKINEATLCIFPSFAEAFPVSWLEAMALNKPIVASNIGWAKEMIEDGENGFLVNPISHSEFAQKIGVLLNDKDLGKRLGNNAKEKVLTHFSNEIIAKQNCNFYQKIISKCS